MRRLRLQAYGTSNGAKELATYMEVKRLLSNGRSTFRGRAGDVIINWGNVKNKLSNVQYVNPLEAVARAGNKLTTLSYLNRAGVSIPRYVTSRNELPREDNLWVARTELYGHSGDGIVVDVPSELPAAPLYTEYIEKTKEYRAIVVDGKVVDFKQKKKRNKVSEDNPEGFEGEHDEHVWNLDGGYIFARNSISHPEEADIQSIKAMEALGLIYGAVDLIENSDGEIFVLEINTAFGLEGETINLVGDALNEYVRGL